MRLSTKLLLISELVILMLVAGMIIPIRVQMRRQAVTDIQHELRAVAATSALQIDGDLHQQVAATQDPDGPAFRALRARLSEIARVNGFGPDNIYTFYLDEQADVLRYSVMLQNDTFIGDPEDVLPHHAMANAGRIYASDLFTDENGQWIVGVAPIRDADGRVVGLLEVNRTAGDYFMRVDRAILITTVAAVLGLALASVAGYLVLRHLVIQPVRAIHAGMLALANHDFAHRTRIHTGDEFEQLADSLNHISEQLNVARQIQAGFVPTDPPASPGYRFAYRSDPCDATGGDYIDAFDLPDGKVAILVADVTGHGIGPSLIMASCRSAFRALAQTGLPPGPLLDKLEEHLIDDLAEGRFITMIFGVLEDDGRFTYTNAGHAPALVVSNGQVTRNDLDVLMNSHVRNEKVAHKDAKMRTFITTETARRDLVLHIYDITRGCVDPDDTLVVVDDSIVRGTTLRDSIVAILSRLNPKKIIVVSSAPPIMYPDCYGIDMSQLGRFIAFEATVALLHERGAEHLLQKVEQLCAEQKDRPADRMVNHVAELYDQFTLDEISDRIAGLLRNPALSWTGELQVMYQSLDGLHAAMPEHTGDWYFTGRYPTPGGYRVLNTSYLQWRARADVRAY